MATIGRLAVVVSASTGAFTTNLKRAVAPLREFGSQVTSVGSKVVSLTGALTALAAGAGLVALTKHAFESIDATAKLADRLGLTTEQLTSLSHAANLSGIDQETLAGAMEKMLNTLGEAATKATPAGAALAKLGLDAATLANQAPDAALRAIADGLVAIHNPAERAAAAVDIFGKSGQQLLPLLLSGAEGIKAAQEEAEKLGLTFSRVDAARVEAANDAMSRLSAIFTGIAQTLAIQLAPFVDALSAKLVGVATSGEGMGSRVVNAFEWVLTAVAKAADWLELLRAGFYMLKAVATLAILGIVGPLTLLIKGVEWLVNKLTGAKSTWGEAFQAMTDNLVGQVDDAFAKAGESWKTFEKGTNSRAVATMFTEIRAKADAQAQAVARNAEAMRGAAANTEDWAKKLQEAAANAQKVTDTIEELRKQIATFGMSEGQKKLFDLKALGATPDQMAQAEKLVGQLSALEKAKKVADALVEMQKELTTAGATEGQKKLFDLQAMGATPEQLAQAEKLVAQLDALDKLKKRQDDLAQKAKSLADTMATPMQKYEQTIQDLNDMLAAGLISFDLYAKGVQKARQELEGMGETDIKGPEAMQAGTAVAQRWAWDQSTGQQRMTKDELQKKALAEAQQSTRLLERIEKNTAKGGDALLTVMDM